MNIYNLVIKSNGHFTKLAQRIIAKKKTYLIDLNLKVYIIVERVLFGTLIIYISYNYNQEQHIHVSNIAFRL